MLRTKKADRIVAFFTAAMLIAAVCLWGAVEPVQGDGSHEIGYESLLFDTSKVHSIEISMDNWEDLIANATSEEYMECDMVIDGENLGKVAIRAKGNTSLSSVATLGSTRYSFKVEFDQYAKGKSYHGLDKLSLNNLIQDATMMKDYLAYTLMGKMGVPAPLCSYVQITVNGEPWGLYLAVEGVEDSFLERNGMTKGELYKPDSMSFGGGRGNGRDFDIENFREKDEDSTESTEDTESTEKPEGTDSSGRTESKGEQPEQGFPGMPGGQGGFDPGQFGGMPGGGDFDPSQFGGMPDGGDFDPSRFGGFGGDASGSSESSEGESSSRKSSREKGGFGGFNFGMGSDDVKLVYTDDDPDSYSNIFNNAKTNISKKDKVRLIESLKKLNEKEDLEDVVNRDEVITYLAVHNFLCNDDSYTGMMVHNYYLYEENGELSIIPWDYNLAFGGFSASGDATSTVNSPIDNPVSSGTTDSRPLIAWIFSDGEALEQYHETYSRFISECIESGWLEEEITRVQEMIIPYLEQDSSAFYSMEEFEKAVSTLKAFCAKRGESIRGQLDGSIPSTTAEQRSSDALIDASDISTSDMGSMNNGKDGGGFGGGPGGQMPSGMPDMGSMPSGMPDMSSGKMPDMSSMPSGMPGSGTETSETEATGETDAKQETAETTEMPVKSEDGSTAEKNTGPADRPSLPEGFSGGGPGGNFPGGEFSGGGYSSSIWIWTAGCAAALVLAVLVIRKFGNHNN